MLTLHCDGCGVQLQIPRTKDIEDFIEESGWTKFGIFDPDGGWIRAKDIKKFHYCPACSKKLESNEKKEVINT